jgi:hypothetical protein
MQGSGVADTIRSGITNLSYFTDRPDILAYGGYSPLCLHILHPLVTCQDFAVPLLPAPMGLLVPSQRMSLHATAEVMPLWMSLLE